MGKKMSKKRGLGRGLNALLAGSAPTEQSQQGVAVEVPAIALQEVLANAKNNELQNLPIEFLQPGRYQPRQDMDQDALEELAASIKSQGIIQPIIARPINDRLYEIIAGERRWRAAQIAGLDTLPVLVRDIPDESAIELALIENIQREDLNPIEEANALARLMNEFNMTQEKAAEAVGKPRTTVTNILRLLSLNSEVKVMMEHGDIDMGHAKALLGLSGEKQNEAAREVVKKDLSVRETEHLVRRLQKTTGDKKQTSQSIDPNIRSLQNDLSEKLGTKVLVQHSAKGKGKLVIHYNSLDELDGIIGHVN